MWTARPLCRLLILAAALAPFSFLGAHDRTAVAVRDGRAQLPSVSNSPAPVNTADIDRFWTAHDAIRATSDPEEKLRLINELYITPGSPGLHALMAARRYTAQEYVEAIDRWPKFWASVRRSSARAQQAVAPLETDLISLRKLYPELRPASITYAIGVLRTGGTTLGDKVLIGAEVALGDDSIDTSELPEPLKTRLATHFRSQPFENNAQNNIHEYIHTQQREPGNILAQSIVREGVAEFIAELATGTKAPLPFYGYGATNAALVRDAFRADMDSDRFGDWLWNSARNRFGTSDVGYYVGYEIAKGYYRQARDKRAAIKTMIELSYDSPHAVKELVRQSGYLDNPTPAPSRTVALTFDDLPFVYPSDEAARSTRKRALLASRRILQALARHDAPATGFVTEEKLRKLGDVGVEILKAWNRGSFELANHGFSHGDSNGMTLAEIEKEIILGERHSRALAHKAGRSLKFFRFPYNHVGDTQAKRAAVEELLTRHGYRLAASTIDTSDYLFGEAYDRAIAMKDGEMRRRIEQAYLAHTRQQVQYYSDLNAKVLGYRPPEIIVLHLNSLNAAVADRLLKTFKDLNFRFVSLKEAQSDPVYQQSPAYATRFGPMWGYRWARDRGVQIDGRLEKDPPQWITTYAAGK